MVAKLRRTSRASSTRYLVHQHAFSLTFSFLKQTHVKGTFLVLKAFVPLAEPSHATVLSLTTGLAALHSKSLPGLSAYMASKFAQNKIIEYLSSEHPNIFAATIHPGLIETAIFNKAGADPKTLPMDKGESQFLHQFPDK